MLNDEDWLLVEMWQVVFGSMGIGVLPYSGGYAEQPCLMNEAFRQMSWASSQLKSNG